MAIKEEYSSYKIVHHPGILANLKEQKDIVPTQVHFVPTNRCNQSCSFCAYRCVGYSSSETFVDQDEISTAKSVEIIKSMAESGVKAIQFTGGGEPLVHKGIESMLDAAILEGLDLAMVTNGMKLEGRSAEMLAKHGSWVRVSVDAGTPETYSSIRRTPLKIYDRVIENLTKFAAMKEQDCILGVGFVVTKENYKEVYACGELMKSIGVDNFRISAAFTSEGSSYFDSFRDAAHELCVATKRELEDEGFTVFNLFDDRDGDLTIETQDYDFCPIKSLVVYVGADLGLYTCCVQAYNKNGLIGSLKGQTFLELWNSESRKEYYRKHNPRHSCKIPCMFSRKNDVINYMIKPNPKHTNFL